MVLIHKLKYENNNITLIRTSAESHLLWKHHFHENSLHFRIYAGIEADIEKDISNIDIKKTNFYKQYPVHNGCHMESELRDVLKNVFILYLL